MKKAAALIMFCTVLCPVLACIAEGETVPIVRSAEITSPAVGAKLSGTVTFAATLVDDDTNDSVSWAVRKGTCAAGVGTVLGNVDGRHDSFTWSGGNFSASADTTSWAKGMYCFVFNPSEGAGEADIRLTREFEVTYDDPTVPAILGFKNPSVPCGGVTSSKIVTVDWSDSTDAEGIKHYDYTIDYPKLDGTRGTWTTYFTASEYRGSLNEGTHYIKVRAEDINGNYSAWSDVCSITLDTIAPQVDITTPSDGSVVSGNLDIRAAVSDANLEGYVLTVKDSDGTVLVNLTKDVSASFDDSLLKALDTALIPNDEKLTIALTAEDVVGHTSSDAVTVTVQNAPVSKDQCKDGGWKDFAFLGFKNQGNCVSYIESNDSAGKRG